MAFDSRRESLQHLNGDMFVAIDCETTGLDPGQHDIIEIGVIPFNKNFEPILTPLHMYIQPRRTDNITTRDNELVRRSNQDGLEHFRSGDLFIEWFETLGMAPNKRLIPVAHNWPFDRAFIMDWLGPANFEYVFSHHYRDTMVLATFFNDRMNYAGHTKITFPKKSLSYVAYQLGIEVTETHRAMADSYTTLQIFKKLIQKPFHI